MIESNDRKAPRPKAPQPKAPQPPKGGESTSETNSPPLGGWGADIKPYNQLESKGKQVGEMFDSIAPAYDFMNTAMTGGLHRWWRNRALRMALSQLDSPAQNALDIACGTGDVSFRLHELLPEAHITGLDLSPGMLKIAQEKLERLTPSPAGRDGERLISFEEGDCLDLQFSDDSFDLITVAYGVRNFERLQDGYAEMYRVLRPGGVLCVIELSEPSNKAIRSIYRLYSRKIIPMIGRMVSKDPRAYTYLPESIAACPQRTAMTSLMAAAGFRNASFKSLTLGVVTIYLAIK